MIDDAAAKIVITKKKIRNYQQELELEQLLTGMSVRPPFRK